MGLGINRVGINRVRPVQKVSTGHLSVMEEEKERAIPEKYLKLFSDEFLRLPSRLTRLPPGYSPPPLPPGPPPEPLQDPALDPRYLPLMPPQDPTPPSGAPPPILPPVVNIYMMYPGLDSGGNHGNHRIHDNTEHGDDTSEWEEEEEDSVASDSTDDLLLVNSRDLFLGSECEEGDATCSNNLGFNLENSPCDDDVMSDDEAHFIKFLTSFSSNEGDKVETSEIKEKLTCSVEDSDDGEEVEITPYPETRSGRNLKKLFKLKIERQRQKSELESPSVDLREMDLDKFPQKLQDQRFQQEENCLSPRITGSYSMEEDAIKEQGGIEQQFAATSTPKKRKERKIHFAEPLRDEDSDDEDDDDDDHRDAGGPDKGRDAEGDVELPVCKPNSARRMANLLPAADKGFANLHGEDRRFSLPSNMFRNNMAVKSMALWETIPEVVIESCDLSSSSESPVEEAEDSGSENNEKLNIATPDLSDPENVPFPKLLGNYLLKKELAEEDGASLQHSTARLGLPIAISMEKIRAMLLGAVSTSSAINDGFVK